LQFKKFQIANELLPKKLIERSVDDELDTGKKVEKKYSRNAKGT
jgi:hypothetical protein